MELKQGIVIETEPRGQALPSWGSTNDDEIGAVAVDVAGNLYAYGIFGGTVNLPGRSRGFPPTPPTDPYAKISLIRFVSIGLESQ